MAALPDFEKMSLEQIEDWKDKQKATIGDLRAGMQAAEEVHARKLTMARAIQALKGAGVEGVTISPEPAQLGSKMGRLKNVN